MLTALLLVPATVLVAVTWQRPVAPVVQLPAAPTVPPLKATPAVAAKVTTVPATGLSAASRTMASSTSCALPLASWLSVTVRSPERARAAAPATTVVVALSQLIVALDTQAAPGFVAGVPLPTTLVLA